VVPHLRTAAVFGAGPIGLLATRLLGALGARVLLVHTSQPRLQTAVELGLVSADRAVLVSEDLAERVLASNDGNRLDAALICTTRQGAPLALRQALELVTDGGCIDLVTNYPEEAPAPGGLVTEQLRHVRAANVCGVPAEGTYLQTNISQRRISLTGHRGTSADHLSQAMRELRSKGTTYAKLVTHVLSLGSAATAIATLANSGERTLEARDCIKAVIDLTLPHRHSTGDGGHGTMP
jgi:threonine dehydrogenase-like Zn-dependent dehydrogenase